MQSESAAPAEVPVVVTSADRMAALAAGLRSVGYTAPAVCARLGIDSIFEYENLEADAVAPPTIDEGLDALIHVFLAGRPIDAALYEAVLPSGLRGLLAEHGLTARTGDADRVTPRAMLYPAEGLLIASDLARKPLVVDAVYPGIAANTGELLACVPDEPCEAFLDLCSGTAIAALLAAHGTNGGRAAHAWAVDVTERSTRFARFNAALNGIATVTIVQGDLWAPLVDLTFDRIVAHPPYVPTIESSLIYRAGGEDGEHVTRRIVEGLPDHLRPGGRLLCSCLLTDRRDAPVQDRVRQMLGSESSDFDIYLLVRATSTPEHYFDRHRDGTDAPDADPGLVARLRKLGVEQLVLGTLVIDRHGEAREGLTARIQTSAIGRRELEWLVHWERAAIDPGLADRLVHAKPEIAAGIRRELISQPVDGTWAPERCRLRTEWPFLRIIEVPAGIAEFLVGCDGRRTIAEHRDRAVDAGLVPPGTDAATFATNLVPLLSSGVLLLNSTSPPVL